MRRRAFLTSVAALPLLAVAVPPANITLGDEVFLAQSWRELEGRRVGVITNQTGVTSKLESLVDAIRRNPAIHLRAIYAPEHGFRGDRTAGSYVPSYTDAATGLPVYSLYGPTRHPSEAMLRDVDVLLFDIQDVGSRAYTFISSMAYAMQSAAAQGKEFWVLDRPNPVGGTLVEGPVLEPNEASFIGLYPIAMRHGMTVGELARLFNERFNIGAKLRVIAMRGYTRAMIWPDTGLQWVPSSPNIPTWQTTFPYLCTGLIDNAGINGGVGTTSPFFYAGGYQLDGDALANRLNKRDVPGVFFRPASWSPVAGFWKERELSGVELMIVDPRTFLAVRSAVEILCAVRDIAPREIEIKEPAALDRDWGTTSLRLDLVNGNGADAIVDAWKTRLDAFRALRERYLLY
ncbi:MAG TPA: DUF1343 domain-containing protein [Alphaproteobacteria bacterium]|nr:DUF1343 domain-containing protein [Alphaproteobacteria bacterium]